MFLSACNPWRKRGPNSTKDAPNLHCLHKGQEPSNADPRTLQWRTRLATNSELGPERKQHISRICHPQKPIGSDLRVVLLIGSAAKPSAWIAKLLLDSVAFLCLFFLGGVKCMGENKERFFFSMHSKPPKPTAVTEHIATWRSRLRLFWSQGPEGTGRKTTTSGKPPVREQTRHWGYVKGIGCDQNEWASC